MTGRTTVRELKVIIRGEDQASAAFAKVNESATRTTQTAQQQAGILGGLRDGWVKTAAALIAARIAWDALGDAAKRTGLATSFREQGLSIEKAREATRGLIGDYELMLVRSQALAFQLDLTDESFAKLAAGAAIMARRMGIDATDALRRLIMGVGKAETELIDELGFKLDQNRAFEVYAERIGKTVKGLTETERRAAILTRVLEQLDARIGDQAPKVEGLASSYERLGASLSNLGTAAANLAEKVGGGTALDILADKADRLSKILGMGEAGVTGAGLTAAMRSVVETTPGLGAVLQALGDRTDGLWMALEERLNKALPETKKAMEGVTAAAAAAGQTVIEIEDPMVISGGKIKEAWQRAADAVANFKLQLLDVDIQGVLQEAEGLRRGFPERGPKGFVGPLPEGEGEVIKAENEGDFRAAEDSMDRLAAANRAFRRDLTAMRDGLDETAEAARDMGLSMAVGFAASSIAAAAAGREIQGGFLGVVGEGLVHLGGAMVAAGVAGLLGGPISAAFGITNPAGLIAGGLALSVAGGALAGRGGSVGGVAVAGGGGGSAPAPPRLPAGERGGGPQITNVNIHVAGSVLTEREAGRIMHRAQRAASRAGMTRRAA